MKILLQRAVILGVGGYFIYTGLTPKCCSFINGANLLIHEGGHFIFGHFGEHIGLWGGTLIQLLFPGMLAVDFFRRNNNFSAYLMLCWFGQNFFHIAPYIKDATAQALPLTTGSIYDSIFGTTGIIHDWNSILDRAGLLELDQWIGNAVWWAGLLVILASVYFGFLSAGEGNRDPEAVS